MLAIWGKRVQHTFCSVGARAVVLGNQLLCVM